MKPNLAPYLTATRGFAAGTDDPVRFLARCLDEVAALESDVHAFASLDLAAAEAAAAGSSKRWKAGKPLSLLDGIPIGVKDVIETRDFPTGLGSALFEGFHTRRDAACVRALRHAGAVIVGKTVTSEFASTHPGPTRNPLDLERSPGGSSSGAAAAVAAGMLSASVATQVSGSIIRPASYCGCFGYKPTLGAINRGGSHGNLSQGCIGVIGASLDDCWEMASLMAQGAGGDPGYAGLLGASIPISPSRPRALAMLLTDGWEKAADAAKGRLQEVVNELNAQGVPVYSARDSAEIAAAEAALSGAASLSRQINAWEGRWPINTYCDLDAGKISQVRKEELAKAEKMSNESYRELISKRAATRSAYAKLAPVVDACITLSADDVAPHGLSSTGDATFAITASLLGAPALSLPLLQIAELPLGLQMIGFEHFDASLFATGSWLTLQLGVISAR